MNEEKIKELEEKKSKLYIHNYVHRKLINKKIKELKNQAQNN